MYKLKPAYIILSIILSFATAQAQERSPLIRGNINISVKKGTIACDLILSNLPDIKNYVIRLNSGMNIHYFKDLKRNKLPLYYDMDTKDSIQSDETKAYYLHENIGNPARYIPEELEVKYIGMYPVVKDSTSGYMGQDWRGNIAFNGYSVRAEGFQGDWYPVLYDKDKKKRYESVRYDVNVICSDCSVLFINGSKPVRGKQARLKSDVPYEMSIFCGDYKAVERKGIWLLNADMKPADEKKLFDIAGRYQAYYEKQFNTAFKGSLSFVQTTPVAEPKDWAFSFYSSPTTFNVGVGKYGLQSLFDSTSSGKNKQVMAHELAHYYFGTLVKPGDEFGHVIEEGFAEYLSYKLTQSLEGEETYKALLSNKLKTLNYLHNHKPFAQVKTANDFGNREYYLYYYAPVIFMAIEQEIGKPAMWKWLNAMVASHNDHADYQFLLQTFTGAVADKTLSEKIAAKYFTSDTALQNAKDELGM